MTGRFMMGFTVGVLVAGGLTMVLVGSRRLESAASAALVVFGLWMVGTGMGLAALGTEP